MSQAPNPTKARISVVVPAYNEEKFLPKALKSITRAAERLDVPVEVIVSNNMSTDRTAEVAREHGARVVDEEKRCISAVRNAGARAATGDILVFSDADNQFSEQLLKSILETMETGRYIGGGVGNVRMERLSLGTFLFGMLPLWFIAIVLRVAMTTFFVRTEHFHAVGGFDEKVLVTEDFEFGKALKREGRKNGLKYKNLFSASVIFSTRKFDEFGDYFLIMHPIRFIRACMGDQQVFDEFWYKPKR